MSQHIAITSELPAWPAIAARLAACGMPVQMRLIDGELAFPTDLPPDDWRELRVASNGKMVTLKRSEAGIDIVCWGNADEASLAFRDALGEAFVQVAAEK